MDAALTITACPTCGSKRIIKVQRDLTGERGGHAYKVPDLEFYECPDCGERVYDRQAMRRIETCSLGRRQKRAEAEGATSVAL